ncbi:MAG: hypothetical protein WC595_00125 [Candidatus Nanoarchaeia archaeon]
MPEYTLWKDFSTGHFHLYQGTDLNKTTRREVFSTYGFPFLIKDLTDVLKQQDEPVTLHYAKQGETMWPTSTLDRDQQLILDSVLTLYNQLVQPRKSKKTSRKL